MDYDLILKILLIIGTIFWTVFLIYLLINYCIEAHKPKRKFIDSFCLFNLENMKPNYKNIVKDYSSYHPQIINDMFNKNKYFTKDIIKTLFKKFLGISVCETIYDYFNRENELKPYFNDLKEKLNLKNYCYFEVETGDIIFGNYILNGTIDILTKDKIIKIVYDNKINPSYDMYYKELYIQSHFTNPIIEYKNENHEMKLICLNIVKNEFVEYEFQPKEA